MKKTAAKAEKEQALHDALNDNEGGKEGSENKDGAAKKAEEGKSDKDGDAMGSWKEESQRGPNPKAEGEPKSDDPAAPKKEEVKAETP